MILHDTLLDVLKDQPQAVAGGAVQRAILGNIPSRSGQVLVLSGVRRCGKSVLQAQVMQRDGHGAYCNFEDTRLYGLGPEDFPAFIRTVEDLAPNKNKGIFLDEVQEIPRWEMLVRSLLDRGHRVCVTGSNASLLHRELGSKLTGRHLSYEITPFSYTEYLAFTRAHRGRKSLEDYLAAGGFPIYLQERDPRILQELLRDIVQRDIVTRYGIRDVRPLMNLTLFLMCNTGQPLSLQKLRKSLQISTVAQTSRLIGFLLDSYLFAGVQKFSPAFRQRIITPAKYYAVDNGLRQTNSPQQTHDLGHRLENAVYHCLRRRSQNVWYAGEKDLWECDFVTDDLCIQACAQVTPENMAREANGVTMATKLPGKRTPMILTLDQDDLLHHDDRQIEVLSAWKWLD